MLFCNSRETNNMPLEQWNNRYFNSKVKLFSFFSNKIRQSSFYCTQQQWKTKYLSSGIPYKIIKIPRFNIRNLKTCQFFRYSWNFIFVLWGSLNLHWKTKIGENSALSKRCDFTILLIEYVCLSFYRVQSGKNVCLKKAFMFFAQRRYSMV